MKKKFNSVPEYWKEFTGVALSKMQELHSLIQESAPNAAPCISYNMPAFKEGKIIAYYAGYENHIGFYPLPAAIAHFAEDLVNYKTSKGAIQFPINKPLPHELIKKIIKFNLKNILNKK